MSALNGFLQNHANGCDFYETGFSEYCTCGLRDAREELASIKARIAELENPWQLIETCPLNAEVLLWSQTRQHMVIAMIIDDKGWRKLATRWMPLPKPPEEK